jgi:hypothetical protein
MADYGDVAVFAAKNLRGAVSNSPRECWGIAAAEAFPNSPSMRAKGCPQTVFLTVCEIGALAGVPASGELRDSENARHARDCLDLLYKNPSYMNMQPRKLWALVTRSSGKAYNQQMHVVLGLAKAGLLNASRPHQLTTWPLSSG